MVCLYRWETSVAIHPLLATLGGMSHNTQVPPLAPVKGQDLQISVLL